MVAAGVIGTCILIALLVISLRWTRAAMTGWLFFFAAIFPTMGVIGFTIVIAADKFVYLPSVGLMMILASLLNWFCRRAGATRAAARYVIAVIVVLALAGAETAASRRYLAYWQDTVTLCERMLTQAPNAARVHNKLGLALKTQGKVEEAIDHYHQALWIEPGNARALNNLGNALKSQGKIDEAISYYRQSLQFAPDSANTHYNLGIALKLQGKTDEAMSHYRQALQLKPDHVNAHSNLGNALSELGKFDEAVWHYRRAVQLKPDFAEAHYNFGNTLKSQGKLNEAVSHYRRAVQSEAGFAEAHHNLGIALQLKGKLNEAINHYLQALQLKPDLAEAHNNLGSVLITTGQLDDALRHFREAARLKPDYLTALNGTARILAIHPDPEVRDVAEAIVLAERAAELTNYKDIAILDTLEVAYVAAGQFDRGIAVAQIAVALASAAQNDELANQIRNRIELYRRAKP
jgi:tetratricopeptide (TPR) repeat protein